MNKSQLLEIFRKSIRSIKDIRFYSTERGYQGQLVAELSKRLQRAKLNGDPIVEEEYQKRFKHHGIRKRPDIIVHIPYERGFYKNRTKGNFIVIQLKLEATSNKAVDDFKKLDLIFEKLHYPLGIFLNISSNRTYRDLYKGLYLSRLHCFAVKLIDNTAVIFE